MLTRSYFHFIPSGILVVLFFVTSLQSVVERELGGISYGGVWKNYVDDVMLDDPRLVRATQFAVNFARKRWPNKVTINPETNDVGDYSISIPQIQRVQFTADDLRPYKYTSDHHSDQGNWFPVIFGLTFNFQLTFAGSFTHKFTLTEHVDRSLHVVRHTFYIERQESDSQCDSVTENQCDSDSQCDSVTENQCDSVTANQCDSDSQCDSVTENQCDSVTANQCDSDSQCDSVTGTYYDSVTHNPYTAIPQQCSDTTVALRVLTYNIWNTNTSPGQDYVKRIRQLARFCRSSGADVIAFQEVRFDSSQSGKLGPNQVEHLAAILTDYQFVYQPAQLWQSTLHHHVEEGVAIFSRHPIIHSHYTLLSRDASDSADGHQRVLLHAVIVVPEFGEINVLTTHLSLSHVARQRSVVEAWHVVRGMKQPVFLTGDFNAEGHNTEIRFLAGHESLHGEVTTDLVDVWEEMYGPQTESGGFTYSTLDSHLTKRLDFIFMKRHPQVKIANVTLWDDKRRRAQSSSDHTGLLTSFELKRSVS